ncbi:MerR family DNA-binding transcriptional regulator (plasmid) [Pontibacillus sp. ALD_SL1]|uniref:MerR family DNA-binding transcriptional regulator n=1 Tax=Pontibacillus sp. ALD_SL1 TaxID=2777185 RepID=UPI001A979771|nr:MerR family DNA-binding transcriptional regulator [Pontibacillus sp. ALD_SL1]QST02699.1 MerR family DNA-binding transcriptional regulator [Pontibacillus sp. ALD_SL1]
MSEYLKIGQVAALFGVESQTIRYWVDEGKMDCVRTPKGHRRFEKDYIYGLLRGERDRERGTRYAVLYLRTSPSYTKQEYDEFERQLTSLSSWAYQNGYIIQSVVRDIADPLTLDREGINELGDTLQSMNGVTVIVESRSSVSYFAYPLFKKWVEATGNRVVEAFPVYEPQPSDMDEVKKWLGGKP